MTPEDVSRLNTAVRDIPDFPKEGILFKDITPILGDPTLFSLALDALIELVDGKKIDKIVGVDARGFIFGAAVADRLGAGFVPLRKQGKLPHECHEVAYALEYGEAVIEIHTDAIHKGETVFLVDDLLATGGTAAAALELIEKVGGDLVAVGFLIELQGLGGRDRLHSSAPVSAILTYDIG